MCFEAEQAWRKVSEWCKHCILPTYLSTKKAANETMSIAHWWDHDLVVYPHIAHQRVRWRLEPMIHVLWSCCMESRPQFHPGCQPAPMFIDKQGRQEVTGKKLSGPPQTRYYCEKKDLNNVVCLSHWCSIEKTYSCLSSDYHSMFILP